MSLAAATAVVGRTADHGHSEEPAVSANANQPSEHLRNLQLPDDCGLIQNSARIHLRVRQIT